MSSFVVESWKQSGSYEEGIQLVSLFFPNHPLLPSLRQGVSPINDLYLRQIIDKIPSQKTVKITEPAKFDLDTNPAEEAPSEKHPIYQQLKALRHKKAIRRNQFFKIKSAVGRASISDELVVMRKEIDKLFRKIELYEKTGEMIELDAPEPVEQDLPVDTLILMKMRGNLRSNISKYRKKLNDATEKKSTDNVKKFSNKLESLETKLQEVERQIEQNRTA